MDLKKLATRSALAAGVLMGGAQAASAQGNDYPMLSGGGSVAADVQACMANIGNAEQGGACGGRVAQKCVDGNVTAEIPQCIIKVKDAFMRAAAPQQTQSRPVNDAVYGQFVAAANKAIPGDSIADGNARAVLGVKAFASYTIGYVMKK